LGYFFDQQVKKFDQKRQLAAEANFDKFLSKSEKWHQKKRFKHQIHSQNDIDSV